MAPAAGVAFDGSVWVTAGSSIGLGEQKHYSISTACQDSLPRWMRVYRFKYIICDWPEFSLL